MIYKQLQRLDEAKLRAVLLPNLPHIHNDLARHLSLKQRVLFWKRVLKSPQKKSKKMGIDMPKKGKKIRWLINHSFIYLDIAWIVTWYWTFVLYTRPEHSSSHFTNVYWLLLCDVVAEFGVKTSRRQSLWTPS